MGAQRQTLGMNQPYFFQGGGMSRIKIGIAAITPHTVFCIRPPTKPIAADITGVIGLSGIVGISAAPIAPIIG